MKPISGAGVGLRTPHFEKILSQDWGDLWFEILADNFMMAGGLNNQLLLEVCERYPVVLHSVGLSLGGIHEIDYSYLEAIKTLKAQTGAQWYSEHLSFSGNETIRLPDLLPLPYTEQAVRHVVNRIDQVQDVLGERILIENVSSYLQCPDNDMSEAEFISQIAQSADCYILLDLNNVYVSCVNHNVRSDDFIHRLPLNRVKQIHLAGYEIKQDYLLDSHSKPVSPPVWDLFQRFIQINGAVPTLIEWDNQLPDFEDLFLQRQQAQNHLNAGLAA